MSTATAATAATERQTMPVLARPGVASQSTWERGEGYGCMESAFGARTHMCWPLLCVIEEISTRSTIPAPAFRAFAVGPTAIALRLSRISGHRACPARLAVAVSRCLGVYGFRRLQLRAASGTTSPKATPFPSTPLLFPSPLRCPGSDGSSQVKF